MGKTAAQKEANKKWEANQESIRVRVKPGMRKKIKDHAAKNNESINQMINRLIEKELKN